MSETLQGRRIPDRDWLTTIEEPDEHGVARTAREPGDYGFVDINGRRELWFVEPNGHAGRITGLRHEITEHDDGTVTVSPSILDPAPGGWHGWLERGVWREA